ncbi:MAG: YdbH domain-containing protein [Methylomonas lenta]|nr:YdbH domain-containing protein [Methylomonas lenta]
MSANQPASKQQKTQARGQIYRFIAVFGLFLLLTGAGVWWQRAAIMQWSLQQILPASTPSLSVAWLGFNQAQLSTLQFDLQTPFGLLSVDMGDIKAHYDLNAAKLESLNINKANIKLAYLPTDKLAQTDKTNSTVPVLPFRQLSIDHLDLAVDTPWGLVSFIGHLTADYAPEKALLLTLTDDEQLIQLQLSPDFHEAKLTATQIGGKKTFVLNFQQLNQNHSEATLDADASAFLKWLTSSSLLPAQIRTDLAASSFAQANFNIAAMQLNLTAKSSDNLENINGRLLLTRNQEYLSSTEIAFNSGKTQIKLDGHLDLAAAEFISLIKSWLPDAVNSWQFTAGNIMGTYRLNWQPSAPLKSEAYLKAYQIDVAAGPVWINDGYIRLDIKHDIANLSLVLAADVPTVQLGKETTIHNLQVKAKQKNQILTLERATFPIFGGLLEILPDSVNINQPPFNLTLGVRKLDLAQLLDSLNFPELSGTGTISGKLPLRLSMDSIEVHGGSLNGTHPGVLRYQGPVADDENIAFKALRNMLYHKLQATFNYNRTGGYEMGLRVEGKNPNVLSGYPVAFNLNLSGQLPELLQKGILAGDFTQPIMEQFKKAGKP